MAIKEARNSDFFRNVVILEFTGTPCLLPFHEIWPRRCINIYKPFSLVENIPNYIRSLC